MDHAENNQGNISSQCYITRYTGTMFITAEENLSSHLSLLLAKLQHLPLPYCSMHKMEDWVRSSLFVEILVL